MIAALMTAGVLGLAPQDAVSSSSRDECEFLRAVLIAEWPLESPGEHNVFQLDPQARERPVYYDDMGATRKFAVDAAFVVEMLPSLTEAKAEEFVPYFDESPPHRISCDFGDLRVTPAQLSIEGRHRDQEALQFPRISLSQPMFSADGRFAIGGYAWSFVAYDWAQDDCLFEHVDGAWRIVECIRFPLPDQPL